ncbi:USP54_3 [Blepharisma stoltei]|uniref:Ubiquitinyl hydrolase 1 n=1 Tax=Blepharisma stoltei TaxID=1481888 RepID=A0AAU9J8R8_9CILI|nr:unnamed protein product [Blepharisma stoltei]
MKTCAYCKRIIFSGDRHDLFCVQRIKHLGDTGEQKEIEASIGFKNNLGDMNCFLNAALQALWHITPIKENILGCSLHCPSNRNHWCILCGIKKIFQEINEMARKSNQVNFDASELRSNLASLHIESGEFKLNSSADSMEVLIEILNTMHNAYIHNDSMNASNILCEPKCPSHFTFDFQIEEKSICACQAENITQWDYCTFSHPFYINDILEESKKINSSILMRVDMEEINNFVGNSSVVPFKFRLADFIKAQWRDNVVKKCAGDRENCRYNSSTKELRLRTIPRFLIFQLVWNDIYQKRLDILKVITSISGSINVESIYANINQQCYNLHSMIIYGLGHYIYCFRNKRRNQWYKCDDDKESIIGEGKWEDFIEDMINSKQYPVGLFYEMSNLMDNYELSDSKLLELERHCLFDDLEEGPKEPDTNQDPTLVRPTPSIINEPPKQIVYQIPERQMWTCKCGHENEINWSLCSKCSSLKAGEVGWVCNSCTFINDINLSICESCGQEKFEHITSPNLWRCIICSFENSINSTICSSCKNSRLGESWKCKYCATPNSSRASMCKNCRNKKEESIDRCERCGKQTPNLKICLDCRIRANGYNNRCEPASQNHVKFCFKCNKVLINWLCNYCEARIEQSNYNGFCPYCNKKDIDFPTLCESCSKICWVCSCGRCNIGLEYQCIYCKLYKSLSINRPRY